MPWQRFGTKKLCATQINVPGTKDSLLLMFVYESAPHLSSLAESVQIPAAYSEVQKVHSSRDAVNEDWRIMGQISVWKQKTHGGHSPPAVQGPVQTPSLHGHFPDNLPLPQVMLKVPGLHSQALLISATIPRVNLTVIFLVEV